MKLKKSELLSDKGGLNINNKYLLKYVNATFVFCSSVVACPIPCNRYKKGDTMTTAKRPCHL